MIINIRLSQSGGTRTSVSVDSSMQIKEVLETNKINYTSATVNLDGEPLSASDLNKSFDNYGITTHCTLTAVTKTNNA